MSEFKQSRTLPALGLLILVALLLIVGLGKQDPGVPLDWQEGWLEVASFQHPRRALAATAANGYLYVIGGVDALGQYVRPVEYAPILTDGRLGEWQETKPVTMELKEGRNKLQITMKAPNKGVSIKRFTLKPVK